MLSKQLKEAHERENKLNKDIKLVQAMKKELIDVRAKQEFAVNEVKLLMENCHFMKAKDQKRTVITSSNQSNQWDAIDENIKKLRRNTTGRKKQSKKKRGR